MVGFVNVVIVCMIASAAARPSKEAQSIYAYPFHFVSRDTWGARSALSVEALEIPVPYVLVHHSYIPPDCTTKEACKQNMRLMQNMHQLTNGWQDIGYNFGVGGEGSVFEGRGWQAVGAHAVGYNVKSIGIVLIGDFVSKPPPAAQIQSLKDLIATGVELGYISPDYKLLGHRQVSATECPGQALFKEISSWSHYAPTP